MPRLPLKYIDRIISKGRVYDYYKRGGIRHSRIHGEFGSLEYMAEYGRLNKSFEKESPQVKYGTVRAIIAEYKVSADFTNLSAKSKLDYSHHLEKINLTWGDLKITFITRKVALTYRDSLASRPATANYRMAVLRKLMSFAVDRGYITVNPATNPRRMKIGTWEPWSQEQIDLMMTTKDEGLKTSMYLALYTGQRESDIITMTRKLKIENRIDVKQHKGGKYLSIPIHSKLKAHLLSQQFNKSSLTFVTRKDGNGYKVDHFKHEWKDEMDRLGISGVVFHGLRKNATINLLEAGCTDHQVAAITGMSLKMVAHYGLRVNQSKLADAAMAKLEDYQR